MAFLKHHTKFSTKIRSGGQAPSTQSLLAIAAQIGMATNLSNLSDSLKKARETLIRAPQ